MRYRGWWIAGIPLEVKSVDGGHISHRTIMRRAENMSRLWENATHRVIWWKQWKAALPPNLVVSGIPYYVRAPDTTAHHSHPTPAADG